MKSAIHNTFTRLSAVTLAFAAVLAVGASQAHAQVSPTTCPSATVFYSNGYSMNTCVPSYYPGYPQTTVYVGQSPYGSNGSYNAGNGFSTTQYNPFTPPVVNNNGLNLFAPAPTLTAPTWYYPPAPNYGYTYTNYPVGGYSGNAFYNTPGNNGYYGGGYGNGYYNGGYGNGYYGGGYGNNGIPYGNDLWVNGQPHH